MPKVHKCDGSGHQCRRMENALRTWTNLVLHLVELETQNEPWRIVRQGRIIFFIHCHLALTHSLLLISYVRWHPISRTTYQLDSEFIIPPHCPQRKPSFFMPKWSIVKEKCAIFSSQLKVYLRWKTKKKSISKCQVSLVAQPLSDKVTRIFQNVINLGFFSHHKTGEVIDSIHRFSLASSITISTKESQRVKVRGKKCIPILFFFVFVRFSLSFYHCVLISKFGN